MGAIMRARLYAAIAAVLVLGSGASWAGCPAGKTRDCAIDLNAVPQISQQIVAGEKISAPRKTWAPEAIPAYTGPTIGNAPGVGRAPEVGYRWAIN